jgi:hypothetical protein
MTCTGDVEADILQELEHWGPCSMEEMVTRLPGYTWNQVFNALDQMSREGCLVLRHPARFDYEVSIGLAQLARVSGGTRTGGRT